MADINVDLGDIRGLRGYTGERGSIWYTGTAITHSSGTATPATGIAKAIVGDMYLNTSTSNVYECTAGGVSGTAVWTYRLNIKGLPGTGAITSTTGSDNYKSLSFTDENSNTETWRANTRTTATSVFTGGLADNAGVTVVSNSLVARGDVVAALFTASNFAYNLTADQAILQAPSGFFPAQVMRTAVSMRYSGSGNTWLVGMVDFEANGQVQFRAKPSGATGNVTAIALAVHYMRA